MQLFCDKIVNNCFVLRKVCVWMNVESLLSPLTFLFLPEKRIFWGYLLISFLIAIAVSGKLIFSKKLWFNRSSLLDVSLLVINQWLYKLLVVPFFALQVSYAFSFSFQLQAWFGRGGWISLSDTVAMLLFTLCLFITQDFFKFLLHYLSHRLPLLWVLHRVHHSANTLTPLTLYRIHPGEMFINATRSFVVTVTVTALFLYLFKNKLGLLEVLGVNLFVFIFNLAASNLRHSPVYIGFGHLERWFISPAQHQIHHSANRSHYNKNFGSALAIWDRLFGCWVASKGEKVQSFGFDPVDNTGSVLKSR